MTINWRGDMPRKMGSASNLKRVADYAESACTMRGCQFAGETLENSRGSREDPPEATPRAFFRAATWPGSSVMVLWVNQPIPSPNDCCLNSMWLPSPGKCTRTTRTRSFSAEAGRELRIVSAGWVIAITQGGANVAGRGSTCVY